MTERAGGATPSEVLWPGIEGLRGVAVAAVLLYHHDPGLLPGGFLGVSLFFTLSGFLITSVLLRHHHAAGRVELRRFWVRRARRLLPVAWTGLLLALGVAWWTRSGADLTAIAGDVRAALFNVANWRFLSADVSYGDALSVPSPVSHYWSLAIEEQFYVVFPLVAAATMRRGAHWFGGALSLALVGSLVSQALVDSEADAYFRTDTRLAELLIGALVAVRLASVPRPRVAPRTLDFVGLAGLVALLVSWRVLALGDDVLYDGGFVVHAVVAIGVVVAAAHASLLPRLLGVPWLVALGGISYGVYVVHFPLFLLLTPDRAHVDGWALLAVRLAATIAIAAALKVMIERPIRFGGALPGWQAGVGVVTAATVALLFAAAIPRVERGGAGATESAFNERETSVVTMTTVPIETTTTSSTAATSTPTRPDPGGGPVDPSDPAPPTTPTTAPPEARPLHLMVVGDSTGRALGLGLQEWAKGQMGVAVDIVTAPGCAFSDDGVPVMRPGWVQQPNQACRDLTASAISLAGERRPDAIVLIIGNTELADWLMTDAPPADAVTSLEEAPFRNSYRDDARRETAALSSIGVPVLWATLPIPAWDLERFSQTVGPVPGVGEPTLNNPQRTALLNGVDDALAAAASGLARFAYAGFIAAPDGSVPELVRPDGLHVDPPQVPRLMDGGLEGLLRDAYRAGLGELGGAERRPTRWSG